MGACPGAVLNSDASENVAYNNPDFPAYIKKGQLSSYPDFRAVSHWHDDLEFILILEGQMTYDVNGQRVSLQAGEGIFVNSRCFHYGYSDTHGECLFICILLSPQLLPANAYFIENCLNPLIQNDHFPYQKLNPCIQWQSAILHDLEEMYKDSLDKIQPFPILEKAVRIFRLLFENMDFFPNYNKNTDDILLLTAMIGYVQKNYPNRILLKDISSAGNCCKTKCTSLFQKYLGTSPMVYLNRYRLEKAVFLLQNTAMSVTETAYSCGFSNSSYFCELFHKYYRTTPGAFRSSRFPASSGEAV
jgi:AraC-like DNA-binding protein